MATHAATHWDSLAHVFYEFKMYNDRDCGLVTTHGTFALGGSRGKALGLLQAAVLVAVLAWILVRTVRTADHGRVDAVRPVSEFGHRGPQPVVPVGRHVRGELPL